MNIIEDDVHIVYASDDRFSEIMGISLISLFENNKDLACINIFILDSGVTLENKSKIESIFNQYARKSPMWIPAKNINHELKLEVSLDRGSLSQYSRLFISSILPETVNRVLYLDCDIILNQSIKELWCLDLHGKTIAALKDAFSKYYRFNIGLSPHDIMFNSGVMLIDLERWKKEKVEDKLLEFIVSKRGKVQQGDQGVLNAVLSKDTYCFEPRFNSVTIFFDFSYEEMMIYRKPPGYYSPPEIQRAIDNPVIIHFTTSFISQRPWMQGCCHLYVEKWLFYKSISPWKNKECWKREQHNYFRNIYIAFIKKLPRRVGIHISSVLQVYVRPFLNRNL